MFVVLHFDIFEDSYEQTNNMSLKKCTQYHNLCIYIALLGLSLVHYASIRALNIPFGKIMQFCHFSLSQPENVSFISAFDTNFTTHSGIRSVQ